MTPPAAPGTQWPVDLGDEILARAREAAARTNPVPATEAELEGLRVEALEQLAALPEPPAYKRAHDPAREQALARLPAAEALLQRALLLARAAQGKSLEPSARAIADTLEALVQALAAVGQGQILPGESAALRAREKARAVSELSAAFHRVLHPQLPVYDRQKGVSRFDPHAPEHLQVTLPCPNLSCKKVALYALSTRSPSHRFVCSTCRQPFLGYFGEVTGLESKRGPRAVSYVLGVEEIGGRERRLEFEDASGGQLPVAPRDLVALLYGPGQLLVAVENLSSSRVLWVKPRDNCFVATAVYGPGASELAVLRRFRDERLMPTAAGRLAVRGYYALGPHLARGVLARPMLWRTTRALVEALRLHLERSGRRG